MSFCRTPYIQDDFERRNASIVILEIISILESEQKENPTRVQYELGELLTSGGIFSCGSMLPKVLNSFKKLPHPYNPLSIDPDKVDAEGNPTETLDSITLSLSANYLCSIAILKYFEAAHKEEPYGKPVYILTNGVKKLVTTIERLLADWEVPGLREDAIRQSHTVDIFKLTPEERTELIGLFNYMHGYLNRENYHGWSTL